MSVKHLKVSLIFLLGLTLQSCMATPPKNPDNICLIFEEKNQDFESP